MVEVLLYSKPGCHLCRREGSIAKTTTAVSLSINDN